MSSLAISSVHPVRPTYGERQGRENQTPSLEMQHHDGGIEAANKTNDCTTPSMNALLLTFLVLTITHHDYVFSLSTIKKPVLTKSRTVTFPVVTSTTLQTDIRAAFDRIVDSTDFFEQNPNTHHDDDDGMSCAVPLFGDTVKVTLREQWKSIASTDSSDKPSSVIPPPYVLTVQGNDALTKDDFGWICVKFLECRDELDGLLDTTNLQTAVDHHFTYKNTPQDPGYAANRANYAGSTKIRDFFAKDRILQTLQTKGFVVMDRGFPKTTERQHELLDKYLKKESRQADDIRTDMVHFLSRSEAQECGLQEHYDMLLGITSFFNDHFSEFHESEEAKFEQQQHPAVPMPPATHDAPLTNPELIQLAEYQHDGFYAPHSDNSVNDQGIRQNYRLFTCILYCNDDWMTRDGGALRIYSDSSFLLNPDDAIEGKEFYEIMPKNGRLLVFDSRMVHSVEPVLHPSKVRRALTLWIKRPTDIVMNEDENE